MAKLTNSVKRNLILSVGTHRKNRLLSPIEVSKGFKIAIDEGMSNKEIAKMVDVDVSIINKFLNLSKLTPKIQYLVDWGQSDSFISFSSAYEITRLKNDEHEELADAILANKFNKNEIVQIIQIRKRSTKNISESIQEILRLRPQIIRQHVFFGSIENHILSKYLAKQTQLKRDEIFKNVLKDKIAHDIVWKGKLGINNFSLGGGEDLAQQLKKFDPDFESVITSLLIKEVMNDK